MYPFLHIDFDNSYIAEHNYTVILIMKIEKKTQIKGSQVGVFTAKRIYHPDVLEVKINHLKPLFSSLHQRR